MRTFLGCWVLLAFSGCGEAEQSHRAPATKIERSDAAPSDQPITKPARAIATH